MDVNIVAGVLSGVVGGGLATLGAILAVNIGIRKLEESEIRKQKVDCIVTMYGLRFVMVEGQNHAQEDRSRLMFEMNRAGVLFADDPQVQNDLRDYRNGQSNERLIALIHSMGKTTKLNTSLLSKSDIENVFLAYNRPLAPVKPLEQINPKGG
jgi:hypothetical protein